jgi:hypothetical protein
MNLVDLQKALRRIFNQSKKSMPILPRPREKDSEYLLKADYIRFLDDCDCAPNGEEWLDRREPCREKRGVWYYG